MQLKYAIYIYIYIYIYKSLCAVQICNLLCVELLNVFGNLFLFFYFVIFIPLSLTFLVSNIILQDYYIQQFHLKNDTKGTVMVLRQTAVCPSGQYHIQCTTYVVFQFFIFHIFCKCNGSPSSWEPVYGHALSYLVQITITLTVTVNVISSNIFMQFKEIVDETLFLPLVYLLSHTHVF